MLFRETRGRPATTTKMILELLSDGEWHEMPEWNNAIHSAIYRLKRAGKIEALTHPVPGFRQRWRLVGRRAGLSGDN